MVNLPCVSDASPRFLYANGDHSLRIYREGIIPRDEFGDIPLGVHDARAQATHLLELAAATTWVPQLLSGESARAGGLSWANGCRPGDMSCH